jgi:nucleolar protein 15
VRVSRNKKSGASKHYAFLEFSSPEVARIAAGAMDGYMLFGQKLAARALPRSEVHEDLFKGANRVFKAVPWAKIERERHNRDLTEPEEGRRTRLAVRRDHQRQQRIKEAGIDYEYAGVGDKLQAKPTKTRFDQD